MKRTLLFHVNSLLTGGIERILIEILKGIDPQKYRIKLSIAFNMGEKEVLKDQIPTHVEVHYLLDHPMLVTAHKNKKTGNTNFAEKALSELFLPTVQKMVKRRKLNTLLKDVDVVIDFDTTLASMHKLFTHKKSIAYSHFGFDNIWQGRRGKLNKLAHRLSHYTHIVMLCNEMKEEAARLYPVMAPKLVKIYNAIDVQRIKDLAKEEVMLTENFRLDGYFVSAGRIHETQKDFTTLIKAYAAAVHKHGIKEHLVIVGDGGSREKMETLASDLGIRERVLFTGMQRNPYKWMKDASLFLFSSKYEGLPTVLIEAHGLKLPIISTATPTGVRELLMNGKAGELVPIGDIEAMTQAILKLAKDENLQREYVRNAQELLPQFEISYMIPELEKLF
ncbi:MAG TPA: glycosyltransferase [Flavipsychrobacter sp.]|nr:glycosyltransferase [Flavipsychrobacter sp.]